MKNLKLLILIFFVFGFAQNTEAQFLKKLKNRAKKAAEEAVIRKTEKKVYDQTSKEMDTLLGNSKKSKKPNSTNKNSSTKKNKNQTNNQSDENTTKNEGDIGFWMSYDFIPGKEVIFYDNMQNEDYGDFPRRWDLLSGNAEVGRFEKEKVLLFYNTTTEFTPLFKEESYLPDAFTIEFDIYFDELANENISMYNIYFNDLNQNPISISSWFPFEVTYKKYKYSTNKYNHIRNFNGWHHIALSYHKGYLKVYFDEQKVLNIPRLDFVPTRINKMYVRYSDSYVKNAKKRILSIKNFKIAKGGGKPYEQVIADGKFVTHGILFDSGKATLKAQSAGVLKRVTDMLIDNPDWKFEIVGHTDSDGTDENNLTLSQQRAKAVKQALIERNISSDRLTTSGKGESEPLNTNNTPEEKANNRRVEFILKK